MLNSCRFITRGGSNAVTESFYFGKPTIVLPIFWDQHGNAQRLDTYGHELEERSWAIEYLLGDRALGERLESLSASLKGLPKGEGTQGRGSTRRENPPRAWTSYNLAAIHLTDRPS